MRSSSLARRGDIPNIFASSALGMNLPLTTIGWRFGRMAWRFGTIAPLFTVYPNDPIPCPSLPAPCCARPRAPDRSLAARHSACDGAAPGHNQHQSMVVGLLRAYQGRSRGAGYSGLAAKQVVGGRRWEVDPPKRCQPALGRLLRIVHQVPEDSRFITGLCAALLEDIRQDSFDVAVDRQQTGEATWRFRDSRRQSTRSALSQSRPTSASNGPTLLTTGPRNPRPAGSTAILSYAGVVRYSPGRSAAGRGLGGRDTTPWNASPSEIPLLFSVCPVTRSISTFDFA